MALGEDTILDAPVTPAPVFAYRALRAVIWGEEDTPEPASKDNQVPATKVHESSDRSWDDRRKPQLQLTPSQKRKHGAVAQPSPSKSILRTPGVNTPRRALLKDMNVKFKDFRKSVSPEIGRKELVNEATHHSNPVQEKENQPAGPETANALGKTEIEPMRDFFSITRLSNVKPQHQNQPTAKEKLPTAVCKPSIQPAMVSTSMPENSSPFDIDAYMRNTEKEMKRLIKYGQKMREYARRQEEDNNKLRLMLDEVRKENERLRLQPGERKGTGGQAMQNRSDNNGRAAKMSVDDTRMLQQQQQQQNTSSKHARPEATKPTSRRQSLSLTVNDSAVPITKPKSNRSHDLEFESHKFGKSSSTGTRTKRPLVDPDANLNPTHSKDPSASPSPPKKQRPSNPYLPALSTRKTTQNQQQEEEDSGDRDTDHPPPLRTLVNGIGSVNKSTTALAPDRLAAARARVRRRAELRKASSGEAGDENVADDVRDVKDGNGNGNGSRVETSLVDWADL